jgi:hypothetical protein
MNDTLKDLGFKNVSYLLNPGIYVLLLKGKIVYVGQTINMFARLGHTSHRERDFDTVYFIKCDRLELDRLEALMIRKFNPQEGRAYNFNNNTDPAHKPVYGKPEDSSLTITIKGTQLTLPLRRRF